ncbi:MAG: BamA/TamA family outer membrane protein [Bacteroidota bacterium]|nr:BamA/TamA family outer membrane protein [Bacteroidota bacterium]
MFSLPLFSQDVVSEKPLEVDNIELSGNKFFDDKTILETFITKISPGAFSKFLYNIFGEKFGRQTEYFFQDVYYSDVERLKQLYHDYGFFDLNAVSSYSYNSDTTAIKIDLKIDENERSYIDSVEYTGIENIDQSVLDAIFLEPKIKSGHPYEKSKINDEATRITEIISNSGYPLVTILPESSTAIRYLSTNRFKITYAIRPGKKYKFGELSIVVEPPREDITNKIITKHLDFKSGELISKNKVISSERNLNRLGLFEAARIEIPEIAASTVGDLLPISVRVKPRDKHEIAPEVILSDEDNVFNLGLGLGYTNRNFLGDARNFNLRLRFNTQSVQEWNFGRVFGKYGLKDNSVQGKVDLNFQIIQPYLFTRTLNGTWTLSLIADKKNFYLVTLVRNKIGLINQFATYTTGFMEWILERSDVNWIEDTIKTGLSITRLKQEEQPQFNSILSFTLQRDKTNDLFSPTEGFFHAGSIEESGILQNVFKNIQKSLPFTQYYKVTLFGRWYKDLSRTKFNILAVKLKAGYQDKYGESKLNHNISIPLNRRFFAGGSGSVRGWKNRELGSMLQSEIPLGGNFLFEGNTELRINHMRGFGKLWILNLENLWAVYFLDYGNLWNNFKDVNIKDVAIASGVGIRYDTFVGPVRFDFGMRVYDPMEIAGKRWFYQKIFFKEVLYNGVLNFGIGHAF